MRHHITHGKLGAGPRWISAAGIAAAAAVTLAACGGGNAATGSGSNTAGSTAKANGPVQVALILKNFTNPYFISTRRSSA
jgi:hypothetical protein